MEIILKSSVCLKKLVCLSFTEELTMPLMKQPKLQVLFKTKRRLNRQSKNCLKKDGGSSQLQMILLSYLYLQNKLILIKQTKNSSKKWIQETFHWLQSKCSLSKLVLKEMKNLASMLSLISALRTFIQNVRIPSKTNRTL